MFTTTLVQGGDLKKDLFGSQKENADIFSEKKEQGRIQSMVQGSQSGCVEGDEVTLSCPMLLDEL